MTRTSDRSNCAFSSEVDITATRKLLESSSKGVWFESTSPAKYNFNSPTLSSILSMMARTVRYHFKYPGAFSMLATFSRALGSCTTRLIVVTKVCQLFICNHASAVS